MWRFSNNSLPLFLVTLAHSQKSQQIFTLTGLCNIVIKVEAYKETSLMQCWSCLWFSHIWVHCKQPPLCLQCGGVAITTKNAPKKDNRLQLKVEAARPSETLVSYCINTWCHNPEETTASIVFSLFKWQLSMLWIGDTEAKVTFSYKII
jgi:hypothetical protein